MRYIPLFVLICFLVGCTGVKKPKKPQNLISKSKMIDILTESYLSNAARSLSSKEIRDKGLQLDSIIFKKYEIDSLQFATSNTYYSTDLSVYTEIFEKVETQLIVLKERADSLKLEEKKLRPDTDIDSTEIRPILGDPLVPEESQEEIE